MAASMGMSAGTLSQIERGRALPSDRQLAVIAEAYGAPPSKWYPPTVLLALEPDE